MDYPRWQKQALNEALVSRRIVLLTGPRQCGKTTLAKQLVSKTVEYRTLDDATLRQAAENDPQGFVESGRKNGTLIIDEVQRVPDILTAVKKVVDQNNRPGQYLLTGSANVQSLPTVQESLAGRVAKIRLRPLSQGEISRREPRFLDRAFSRDFRSEQHTRKDIVDFAFRGGFPEAVRLPADKRKNWHQDYIDALIERDLKDVANIHKTDVMRELVDILAAWSSKFMIVSDIGAGLALERKTLASYISALEALYLVETVAPWTKTDYDRVGKQSKIFMSDTGMMAALLGWKPEQMQLDSDRAGKMFETFAYNQLAAQIDTHDNMYRLYHYRDREKREIDFLIEREDQSLLGVEVKSGSTVRGGDFQHLRWFEANLTKKGKPFTGIVLYTGESVVPFGDNLWAVPFGAL
ncbi:MAG: ATP-binding protein [Proteobacteria bacterium]|nr:ATP-binding protein [Pseudomonadota bacterium]